MSDERMSEELAAVENALSSLRPTPTGVDRDRVMYLAGRAAAGGPLDSPRRPAGWLWPSATAASLLLAVTFATVWLARGKPVVVYRDRPVAAPQPAEQPRLATDENEEVKVASPQRPWRNDYLQLRRLLTAQGANAIPETGSAPASQAETLRWGSGFERTLEELLEG